MPGTPNSTANASDVTSPSTRAATMLGQSSRPEGFSTMLSGRTSHCVSAWAKPTSGLPNGDTPCQRA